jgi:prepilin-type N-terminal cleavage/methylation domain-containing protein
MIVHASSSSKSLGFTLIETLITLVILLILMTLAAPKFEYMMAEHKLTAEAHQMLRMLAKTRETAIYSNRPTLLCGLDQQNTCVQKDFERMVIFQDLNKNEVLDEHETVIQEMSGSLQTHWILNISSFQFLANGSTYDPGSILICHHRLKLAKRVLTSMAGRSYNMQPIHRENKITLQKTLEDCHNS